jgi:HK97 gp10 family phage protein
MNVSIEGDLNLKEKADEADAKLYSAVSQAIEIVREEAVARAPTSGATGGGELRNSIFAETNREGEDEVTATCWTNKEYAPYVEFGTGPKGAANHSGTSPEVAVAYRSSPWWVHEGTGENEVDRATGEFYHWPYIDTEQGRFYHISGQAAQPFMYPALKNNEDSIVEFIRKGVFEA